MGLKKLILFFLITFYFIFCFSLFANSQEIINNSNASTNLTENSNISNLSSTFLISQNNSSFDLENNSINTTNTTLNTSENMSNLTNLTNLSDNFNNLTTNPINSDSSNNSSNLSYFLNQSNESSINLSINQSVNTIQTNTSNISSNTSNISNNTSIIFTNLSNNLENNTITNTTNITNTNLTKNQSFSNISKPIAKKPDFLASKNIPLYTYKNKSVYYFSYLDKKFKSLVLENSSFCNFSNSDFSIHIDFLAEPFPNNAAGTLLFLENKNQQENSLFLKLTQEGRIWLSIFNMDSSFDLETDSTFLDDNWHSLLFVKSNNQILIYVDNIIQVQKNLTTPMPISCSKINSGLNEIDQFVGYMSAPEFFDFAISPEQLMQNN
jgi:hypothetical protein